MSKEKFIKVATVQSVENRRKGIIPVVEEPEPTVPEAPVIITAGASIGNTGPRYATKCIYFPDKKKVQHLEEVLAKFPRATLSTLMSQVIEPLTIAIEQLPEGQRQVAFELRIWV